MQTDLFLHHNCYRVIFLEIVALKQSKAKQSKGEQGFYLAQAACFAYALLYSANALIDPKIDHLHEQSKVE